MFNYAEGTEAEKAWVDGISDVDLVAYGENNQTLNGELEWTLDKEAPPRRFYCSAGFRSAWDRSTFSQTAVTS